MPNMYKIAKLTLKRNANAKHLKIRAKPLL